jgi:hypothetical protein
MKYIYTLILFTSCVGSKNIADKCADKFIIKDSVIYQERYDTIYEQAQHDTLIFWGNKYIVDTIKSNKIISINKYIDKIIYRENAAKIYVLNNQNNVLKKTNDAMGIRIDKLEANIKVYKIIRNTIIAISIFMLLLLFLLKKLPTKWL